MSPETTSSKAGREGLVIRGMYRLARRIGRGGMGEIYEADHVSIPRKYAIKILRGDFDENAEALSRFHREASIAAALGSKHIVEVYDFGEAEDDLHFMAMELLVGESVADHLARVGALSAEQWLHWLRQLSEGLHAAHVAGIVHRDLKPDNLFLAQLEEGEVLKILDFGISKIQARKTLQTQAGAILGTPNYMSPEQAEGAAKDVDARADIFSLGAISYEALAGKMAFDGPTLMSVFMAICYQHPEPLQSIAPNVPSGVVDVINRALAKDPNERFASVPEFLAAYEAGMSSPVGGPVTAPVPVARPETPLLMGAQSAPISTLSAAVGEATLPTTPAPRRRWVVPAVAGGVVALGVAVVLAVVLSGGKKGDAAAARATPAAGRESPDAAEAPMTRALVPPDAAAPRRVAPVEPLMQAAVPVMRRPHRHRHSPPRVREPARRPPPPRRRAWPPPRRRRRAIIHSVRRRPPPMRRRAAGRFGDIIQ